MRHRIGDLITSKLGNGCKLWERGRLRWVRYTPMYSLRGGGEIWIKSGGVASITRQKCFKNA